MLRFCVKTPIFTPARVDGPIPFALLSQNLRPTHTKTVEKNEIHLIINIDFFISFFPLPSAASFLTSSVDLICGARYTFACHLYSFRFGIENAEYWIRSCLQQQQQQRESNWIAFVSFNEATAKGGNDIYWWWWWRRSGISKKTSTFLAWKFDAGNSFGECHFFPAHISYAKYLSPTIQRISSLTLSLFVSLIDMEYTSTCINMQMSIWRLWCIPMPMPMPVIVPLVRVRVWVRVWVPSIFPELYIHSSEVIATTHLLFSLTLVVVIVVAGVLRWKLNSYDTTQLDSTL